MTRRDALRGLAMAFHTAWAGLLAWGSAAFLGGPRRTGGGEGGAWKRVARLEDLPRERPMLCDVRASRSDGFWAAVPHRIGAVWVRRVEPDSTNGRAAAEGRVDGSEVAASGSDAHSSIRAWQSICPHLGCGIEFVPSTGSFSCPCHASAFNSDGVRSFGPSPRDMDALECRVVDTDSGERWVEVRYREFETGVAARIERGPA